VTRVSETPGTFDSAGQAGRVGASPIEIRPPDPARGLVRRFLTTHRHFLALLLGGWIASIRRRRDEGTGRGLLFELQRALAWVVRIPLDRTIVDLPFPVQLRKRLERLGPTYVKLGQILSLREDVLPVAVTDELKRLLDRLPAIPFDMVVEVVERDLCRPLDTMFVRVDTVPLGSASIAQAHRALTVRGDDVILKVVKPGIREILRRDTRLMRVGGRLLNLLIPRFQPRRIIDEFCDYTLREVDLKREADNAETFEANFRDEPDVVFPRIFREYSGVNVLCMSYLDGIRPDSPAARELSEAERDRLIDLGASSIIRMLYRDGFFHADLHPANLLILPGPRVGFIDLGMVGRFESDLRRTLLYYYYCLVIGDSENAARYLAAVAQPAPGGDPAGFRREVEEISRRWRHAATFEGFSLARLILESVTRGARFRMYFPVELVLMVKALVTFEGVGHLLRPGFDVAAVSRTHINRIFVGQFNPIRLLREGLRGAPEILDAMVRAPMLMTEGLRMLERSARQPPQSPLAGLRGTLFAGACLVAGAILAAAGGPWPLWVGLFLLAGFLALRRGS